MFKPRPLANLLAQTLATDTSEGPETAILLTASGALLAQASRSHSPSQARVMAALAAGIWTHSGEAYARDGDEESIDADKETTMEIQLEHGRLVLQPVKMHQTLLGDGAGSLLVALQGTLSTSIDLLRHRAQAVASYIEKEAAQLSIEEDVPDET